MKRIFAALLGCLSLLALAPVQAQQFPLNMPANSVYGRLGIGTGPGSAIPFATLANRLVPFLFSAGLHAESYGVKCNGVTDDTAALNGFLSVLGNGSGVGGNLGILPSGTCLFSGRLTVPVRNDWGLTGQGTSTLLKYVGSSTTTDLVVVGNGVDDPARFTLKDFRIDSATVMTSGYALRLRRALNFQVDGVNFGPNAIGVVSKLYNAVYAETASNGKILNANISGNYDGVTASFGTELYLSGLRMSNAHANVHAAGAYGGLYVDAVSASGGAFGLLVDNAIVPAGNNQIFVMRPAAFDFCSAAAVQLDDAYSTNKSFTMAGWGASTTAGPGLNIVNWRNGTINLSGAQFVSNNTDGVKIQDATARVYADRSNNISANGGYGFNATVATSLLFSDALPFGNSSGAYSPNVSYAVMTQHALMLGGGTGMPTVVGSLGTSSTVLHGNASGDPTFAAVANADLVNSATTVNGQTCTLGSTCTVAAAASSAAVGSTAITGGTTMGLLYNNVGVLGNTAAGTNGQLLLGVTSGAPVFGTMSGEASITNAGVVTLGNAGIIAKVLTGYTSGAGTISATDTLLSAIQKLNGNDALKLPLAGGTLTGNLLFTDNTLDIGASGATRPRTGYFGTSLISPLFNGLAIANNGTNTLAIAAGKTLTVSNTITFTATDGSTLAIGTGGTLGSNAYTSTAFAPLASPALTGTPTAPTAAVDTNTTQIATTAMVLAQAASATPLIDGTAAAGTSTRYARGDHIHPTDTTRAPLASPTLTGTPAAPTAALSTNTTQLATTAFVLAQFAAPGAIGGTTPAAGAFTTLTASTSLTSPLVVGGSAVGSILSLQSTSGVGTTDIIKFLVGNNGATEAARFQHSGGLSIGGATDPGVGGLYIAGTFTSVGNQYLGDGSTSFAGSIGWSNLANGPQLLLGGSAYGAPGYSFQNAGSNKATINNGVQIGAAPTGGDKGNGTLNMQGAIYANGTIGATCGAGFSATTGRSVGGIVTAC